MGLYAGRLDCCPSETQRTAMTNKEFRPKLIAHLIAMADANDDFIMDGTEGPIRDVLSRFEQIFAIWRDASQPDDIDVAVVEGWMARAHANPGRVMKSTAIWCHDRNEAFWVLGQFAGVRRAGLATPTIRILSQR